MLALTIYHYNQDKQPKWEGRDCKCIGSIAISGGSHIIADEHRQHKIGYFIIFFFFFEFSRKCKDSNLLSSMNLRDIFNVFV
jgi:hypothetical protein